MRRYRLALTLISLTLTLIACRHDHMELELCQRDDLTELCQALTEQREIEALIFLDPVLEVVDPAAIDAFVEQVRLAIGEARVIDVLPVTGLVLARLDAQALQAAAAVPNARLAPNRFHTLSNSTDPPTN